MADPRFLRPGFDFALAHAIEECGEFLAAAGKTQRWGRQSTNPVTGNPETNEAWLKREAMDVRDAIGRLEVAMGSESEVLCALLAKIDLQTTVAARDAEIAALKERVHDIYMRHDCPFAGDGERCIVCAVLPEGA